MALFSVGSLQQSGFLIEVARLIGHAWGADGMAGYRGTAEQLGANDEHRKHV
jgi:hypothetical protein